MRRGVGVVLCLVLLAAGLSFQPVVPNVFAGNATVEGACDDAAFDDALETANDGGGTITFDCPANTEITLDSEKIISAEVVIDGDGDITLDGNESNRIFFVSINGNLALENITLTNGSANSGGAIFNTGAVTITNSNFFGNEAEVFGGAILNSSNVGAVTITNSTFSDNSAEIDGGAISGNVGDVTITNSTFSDNSTVDGGAIYTNVSDVTIANSTFSGNTAAEDGGAIYSHVGNVTIRNSTFSDNSADVAGGAIYNLGDDVTISASILAGDDENCDGDITSGGYNLTDDDSCGFNQSSDIDDGDANLGDLQDNGGPTETMLPGLGSAAINAVSSDFCDDELPASDQRGIERPQLGLCDIGAVEVTFDEIPEQTLCANRYNGDLRMPRTDACASTETAIDLPNEEGVDLCTNRYNGDVRYSRTGACASTETAVQVNGFGGQSVCVNRYNGNLRVPRVEGQCASTETARMI